jgi:hypothetical protein
MPQYEEIDQLKSKDLAYQFLDTYEAALNKRDFVERTKHLCPDISILEAIWEMIDLLTIGGR